MSSAVITDAHNRTLNYVLDLAVELDHFETRAHRAEDKIDRILRVTDDHGGPLADIISQIVAD